MDKITYNQKYIISLFRLVFGILYPAYNSYKAIRTKNVKEYVRWMSKSILKVVKFFMIKIYFSSALDCDGMLSTDRNI